MNKTAEKIFRWDNLLLLMAFITPLSIAVQFAGGLGLSVPLEPLLALLCIIFILKIFYEKTYDRTILQQPLTILIILYLLWMSITTITSEMPLISLKQVVSKSWYIIPAFFMCAIVFKDISFIIKFIWAYLLPLCAIIVYSSINLIFFQGVSHFNAHIHAASPFFNEHTEYATIITIFLPLSIYLCLRKKSSLTEKITAGACSLVLITGLILSFSRGAWISMMIAFFVFLLIILRPKTRKIVLFSGLSVILLTGLFLSKSPIKYNTSNNFIAHFKSSANFTSNASNLERINRWKAGLKMVQECPIYGKGPGAYQFLYGPYQDFKYLNEGSTHQGNIGTIHNEYLTALVDSGIIGGIIFITLVIFVFITGIVKIKKSSDKEKKNLYIAIIVVFTAYFLHAFFNNFLYMEKIAIPIFGLMAILTAKENNASHLAKLKK